LAQHLLLILLVVVTLGGGGSALALDTARASTTVGRGKSEVDVLLGVEADNERRDVDNLLANADVTLTDQDTGVVDGLGQTDLEDLGLQATLQEILNLQGKHVIETHAGLIEDTDANETANEGVTLEEALGVLVFELEELTGSTTNFGEGEGDTPDLALVAETVFTGKLQLGIETSRLERSAGDLVGLRVVPWGQRHF